MSEAVTLTKIEERTEAKDELPPPRKIIPSDVHIREHPTDPKKILVKSAVQSNLVWECGR